MITPPPNFFGHSWSHNLTLRQRSRRIMASPSDPRPPRLPLRAAALRVNSPRTPLCTMLPGEIRSPVHREHALTHSGLILSSSQSGPCTPAEMARVCSVCRQDTACSMRTRHYRCGGACMFVLHIGGCVSGVPPTTTPEQSSSGREDDGGAAAAPEPPPSSRGFSSSSRSSSWQRISLPMAWWTSLTPCKLRWARVINYSLNVHPSDLSSYVYVYTRALVVCNNHTKHILGVCCNEFDHAMMRTCQF
uniref:Uncharacterized protein n=1 Tax=Oryza meridionalis TaxID=40149 RepID=A0A0E0EE84_9ORYZ